MYCTSNCYSVEALCITLAVVKVYRHYACITLAVKLQCRGIIHVHVLH